MSLRSFYVLFGLMCTLHVLVEALPPMNIRKLYESASESRNNKDDLTFPQPDEDVLELEQLKEKAIENLKDALGGDHEKFEDSRNANNSLPALQKQLETETIKSDINMGQPEEEDFTMVQQYRSQPTTLTTTISTTTSTLANQESPPQESQNTDKIPLIKPFYGAARLTYGQNPEVIAAQPTTTTTTTIPTNGITSSINLTSMLSSSSTAIPTPITNNPNPTNVKTETEDESVSAELQATKNGERRSIGGTKYHSKNPEHLLKNKDGQYSAFDMAQYIFWTGDEAGVARAVEEFIHEGLMSRENAIKFLRDIRLGIEYLQNSYTNRVLPIHLKRVDSINIPKLPTATSTTTITTTKKPINLNAEHLLPISNPTMISKLPKNIEGTLSVSLLQGLDAERNKKYNIDYEDVAVRTPLNDFLYAQYSLEEVVYELAKVMFSLSLTHGSEQAQRALQRLTRFIESEGECGRLPPALQKKILDVLLAALTDTLGDHPELMSAARARLGNAFRNLPLEPIKN